jgi:hypothetical protein
MDFRELMRIHPDLSMPTQFCLAGRYGYSTICFHNYYDRIFQGAKTPVELHLFFFDGNGNQVRSLSEDIDTGAFFQFDSLNTGINECGLVAAMAVPKFDLAKLSQGKLRLRREIGTGFYIIWRDAAGHVDTMHEWASVRRTPLPSSCHYLLFDKSAGGIADVAIIVTNPIDCPGASVVPAVVIYDRHRNKLGDAVLDAVAPMGARVEHLAQIFPKIPDWFDEHGALGIKVFGKNLIEPLTMEIHRSGDFHIHHIN